MQGEKEDEERRKERGKRGGREKDGRTIGQVARREKSSQMSTYFPAPYL